MYTVEACGFEPAPSPKLETHSPKLKMNILLATSEAVPFAKTGGLADVCGALPIELARLGHQAAVILPGLPPDPLLRPADRAAGDRFHRSHRQQDGRRPAARARMPGSNVPVYLVEQDQYFDRDELYSVDGKDYIDNCERFVFFCRAVLEAIRLLGSAGRRAARQRLADRA